MGFTKYPNMVRVDFFKKYHKWYDTEELYMEDKYYDLPPTEGVLAALRSQFEGRYKDMIAIVLHPYSKYSYPVIVDWDGRGYEEDKLGG